MGNELSVTLIDVGWGDSIFIESKDEHGNVYFALIDSNDKKDKQATLTFLKRYFEKVGVDIRGKENLFEFIMLSHAHADHGQGLKSICRTFGTKNFWYPKARRWGALTELIKFSNNSNGKIALLPQAVDDTNILPQFGPVKMEILWPPSGDSAISTNENNNSIVLRLTLNDIEFVLTGDAEMRVWRSIANRISGNTKFFKVPHHGAKNGTIDGTKTQWLDKCPTKVLLGISCSIRPYKHPHIDVINLLNRQGRTYYRTDEHYHITVTTNGSGVTVKYSHI